VKRTVAALCCATSALTIFVPSAGAAPLSGPGDEICQVLGDNGGTYFLSVTSRRDNDLSQCDAGTPLQASIDDLLGNPKYGPNVDRRCIYDITTDLTVDAIVGVYSSGREVPRQQHVRDVVGIDAGQVWQLDRELGSCREQVLLAAEVADHQRRIHADIGRDGAQGGAFVAFRPEAAARRGEDVGAGLDGVAGRLVAMQKILCHPLLTCDELRRMV
jgi:hypothetical protein